MAEPLIPVAPLRLRHGHGERLLRHDADGQDAQDGQLRWWHNRAVHRAYGVVQGLGVRFDTVARGRARGTAPRRPAAPAGGSGRRARARAST